VVRFLSRYLAPEDRAYVTSAKRRIRYVEYDWSLNEAAAR
jgi:hypothetical protein